MEWWNGMVECNDEWDGGMEEWSYVTDFIMLASWSPQ